MVIKELEIDKKFLENERKMYNGCKIDTKSVCSLCKMKLFGGTFRALVKKKENLVASSTVGLCHTKCFKKFYTLKKNKQNKWRKFSRAIKI